jgi:phage protein U
MTFTSCITVDISDFTLHDSSVQETSVGDAEASLSLVLLPLINTFGGRNSLEGCRRYAIIRDTTPRQISIGSLEVDQTYGMMYVFSVRLSRTVKL